MVSIKDNDSEEKNMNKISESERKRLESLKQRKQAFKAKELAIQNALKNLDGKTNQNKIVFDEDLGNVNDTIKIEKTKEIEKKRKHDLFDDDSNDDDKHEFEAIWDERKFEVNKNIPSKLLKHNIALGNDKRFKLDERFIEDENETDENVTTETNNETDLQKEKELELDILGNILGAPIKPRSKTIQQDSTHAKKGMIRYDPTQENHKEYEIKVEKSARDIEKFKGKKKKKENLEQTAENTVPEVSKDVFFSISDSLSKNLGKGGEFSLLKSFGKVEDDKNAKGNNNTSNTEPLHMPKFKPNFTSKNPFKYDSSDDEENMKESKITIEDQNNDDIIQNTNKFFFDDNDARFNEAKRFFSQKAAPEDNLQELRQQLKHIVRSKVRKNLKKKEPWGSKKKIRKVFKK